MKYPIKPITQSMICDLQKARETVLSTPPGDICSFYNFYGTLSALHERDYVAVKTIYLNGSEKLSVHVTQRGINFLQRYEKIKKIAEPSMNGILHKLAYFFLTYF